MSVVDLLVSDYPMSFIDLQTMKPITGRTGSIEIIFLCGLKVSTDYYFRGYLTDRTDETDPYLSRPYRYEISLEVNDSCVEALRQYLTDNMETGSDVEIWRIWVGTGLEAPYDRRVRARHIPCNRKKDIDKEVDQYWEEKPAVPKVRQTTIQELQIDDIMFLDSNLNACLSIWKDSVP